MRENKLLIPKIRGITSRLYKADRKITITTQITTYSNGGIQKMNLECQSGPVRTGSLKLKNKTLPGLMSFNLCCIRRAGSAFWCKEQGSIDPSHCISCPCCWWCNAVKDISDPVGRLWHLNDAQLELSIVADHFHPFVTTLWSPSDGCFQKNTLKAQITSNQMAFTVSRSKGPSVMWWSGRFI